MTYPLNNVRLFQSFSDIERAELLRYMRERKYVPGQTVCRHGEYGNTMLLVTQGALSAVVPGRDDGTYEIARLTEGSVFGEMFCIDPAPRPVTLIASEGATVLELGRDDLVKMRQQAPSTAAALVSAVFQDVLKRLRSVDDRIDRELRSESHVHEKTVVSAPLQVSLPKAWAPCFVRLRGSA